MGMLGTPWAVDEGEVDSHRTFPSSPPSPPRQSIADQFAARLAAAVDQLQAGLPWQKGVAITPVPAESKPAYLQALIRRQGPPSVLAKRGWAWRVWHAWHAWPA